MKIEFSKPYVFEGEKYESIELDLDGLNGEDMLAANKQFSADGRVSLAPSSDMSFHAWLASRASKKPYEFFMKMPAKDFANVMQHISNFLMF